MRETLVIARRLSVCVAPLSLSLHSLCFVKIFGGISLFILMGKLYPSPLHLSRRHRRDKTIPSSSAGSHPSSYSRFVLFRSRKMRNKYALLTQPLFLVRCAGSREIFFATTLPYS